VGARARLVPSQFLVRAAVNRSLASQPCCLHTPVPGGYLNVLHGRRGEEDLMLLKEKYGVLAVVSMSEDWEITEQEWPDNMIPAASLEW
jgi:hypothetical protein